MNTKMHDCGGTILSAGSGEQAYNYCDKCGAFIYTSEGEEVPNGTDPEANRAAWDAGDLESPSA